MCETISCETADFPVRAALEFDRLLRAAGRVLGAFWVGTEDVASAYRRILPDQPQFTIVALWDPSSPPGRVVYVQVHGFNFGLKSAVLHFNRYAIFVSRAATRMLRVCNAQYYDDFCVAEPAFTRGQARTLLRGLAALLRLPFSDDPRKSLPMAPCRAFLGVVHDFSGIAGGFVTSGPSAERVRDLCDRITAILGPRRPAAGEADSLVKLTGALQFTLSWAAGRCGRAALQPLYAAVHSRAGPRLLGADVRQALAFLLALLPVLRPRRFRLRGPARPPVLVWTDASWAAGEGRIGVVIYVPGESPGRGRPRAPHRWYYTTYAASPEVIARLQARRTLIGQLELLGVVMPYYSMPELFAGREVLHYIDNTEALAASFQGSAASSDMAMLAHALWAICTGLDARPWFFYVRSKANVADLPSRDEFDFVCRELGAVYFPPRVPDFHVWASPAAACEWAEMRARMVAPTRAPPPPLQGDAPPRSRRDRKRPRGS
jgi:hypothetical protein